MSSSKFKFLAMFSVTQPHACSIIYRNMKEFAFYLEKLFF